MDDQKQAIKANAQFVVEQLRKLAGEWFGLNIESVEWVEGYIERLRSNTDFDESSIGGLVNTLGSFLGECIIAAAGGEWLWVEAEQTWGISFPYNRMAFPFAKVHKQLVNGIVSGDSIVSFYDVTVNYLVTGKLEL
jgi:hypothetical protein